MRSFPASYHFRREWRSYQARVLAEFESCLEDGRLHLIAPPGSGKTVIGLEIVRRLNKPALILSPTLTIRDQWAQRLMEHFLPPGSPVPDWISFDLHRPGFLTLATYQALHAAVSSREDLAGDMALASTVESEKDGAIDRLCRAGWKTLVLDEAHHLRNEWWHSLVGLRDGLNEPVVVSLTATPPYDVTIAEWERYEELCGRVDCEISIPELVLKSELCHHQDYVWFCPPSPEESARLDHFHQSIERLVADLRSDQGFASAIAAHPWLTDPGPHTEEIARYQLFVSSMVIFLLAAGRRPTKQMLYVAGLYGLRAPALDAGWLETMLTGCLYTLADRFPLPVDRQEEWRRRLERLGAVERRQVCLRGGAAIERCLTASVSKLAGIVEIVAHERKNMGQELRLVILTDFIRLSELPRNAGDIRPLTRIGSVTVFEALRRRFGDALELGVLSGGIVILPLSAAEVLSARGQPGSLRLTPLAHDPRYVRVEAAAGVDHSLVVLVTALLMEGRLKALIGTKSLLGEGWDAPAVNALILGSYVGSYVTSNQMRGRAIRSYAPDPAKTANVWHLVCAEDGDDPGADYAQLARRFKAFAGVAGSNPIIENGIGRLELGDPPFTEERTAALNARTLAGAADRAGLRDRWEQALLRGREGVRLVEQITANGRQTPRRLVVANTIRAVAMEGLLLGGNVLFGVLRGLTQTNPALGQPLRFASLGLLLAALVALPKCLKALWLFFKHGSIESSLRQVGEVVMDALAYMGVCQTERKKLKVVTEAAPGGARLCSLQGGTAYEQDTFLDAFQELLDPIGDPRYLLVRRLFLSPLGREDYLAIPSLIGRQRKFVDFFLREWKRRVGSARAVFTRSPAGHALLLRARMRALTAELRKPSDRISRWKASGQ